MNIFFKCAICGYLNISIRKAKENIVTGGISFSKTFRNNSPSTFISDELMTVFDWGPSMDIEEIDVYLGVSPGGDQS